MSGQAHFLFTKDASNRQGEGASYAFTVPTDLKAKVVQIELDYMVMSGTFVAGSSSADSDLIWYIYDVTNSVPIELSSIKLLSNSSTLTDKFIANFQTSATGTSYRLICHVASTSASAYTLAFKNIKVSPCNYVYGTPISDWVSYTPTGSWTTNTTYTGRWRRVGDSMQVYNNLSLTGAPGGTSTLSFNLPSGYTIDTSKTPGSVTTVLGSGIVLDGGTSIRTASVVYNSTNSVALYSADASGDNGVSATNPITFGNNDQVSASYFVAITGWSSSTQVSDGYDGRLIAAKYTNSSTTLTNNTEVTLTYSTKVFDSTANYSSGTYTVSSSGKYKVNAKLTTDSFSAAFVNSSHFLLVYQNGVLKAENRIYANITNSIRHTNAITTELDCVAGDTIQIRYSHDMGATPTVYNSNSASYLEIEKLSSPQTMSATEVVAARYTTTNNQSLSGAATTIVNYEVKTHSTHDSVTVGAGSWNFKAPVSGFYKVQASIRAQAKNYSTGDNMVLYVYKNGAEYGWLGNWTAHTNLTSFPAYMGDSDTVQLNAGDTLDVRIFTNTTINLDNNSGRSHINIERIK